MTTCGEDVVRFAHVRSQTTLSNSFCLQPTMKRTLEMVESDLEEAQRRVVALKTERKAHPEHMERKSRRVAYELTDSLYERFVTNAQGPRLIKFKTTFTEGTAYVKDSLYRDEWRVEMTFSDGTRFSENAEFWKYESEPVHTFLDISPYQEMFESEEALWDAFYAKNRKRDRETLAAIALAAHCVFKQDGDDNESIPDAWVKYWCRVSAKHESDDDDE
jgi:hypothetical protein